MSIERCVSCSRAIDTDHDPECYRNDRPVCEPCRDDDDEAQALFNDEHKHQFEE